MGRPTYLIHPLDKLPAATLLKAFDWAGGVVFARCAEFFADLQSMSQRIIHGLLLDHDARADIFV
jgi:hypothetical protein